MARRLVTVWIALLVLLALSAGSALVSLGPWNSALNLAIACVKAMLVALFFMKLSSGPTLPRMVALVALFTLALLLGLTGADYATRRVHSAPWTVPPPGQTRSASAPVSQNSLAAVRSQTPLT